MDKLIYANNDLKQLKMTQSDLSETYNNRQTICTRIYYSDLLLFDTITGCCMVTPASSFVTR
jgi:hypothetical protein